MQESSTRVRNHRRSVAFFPGGDLDFAWRNLRLFKNSNMVCERICERHQLKRKQRENATKQAKQLGLCIEQAEQYFAASRIAGHLTRPTLLYYGLMSLALAEVLWKQDGDSSLDRLRDTNAHHGLTLDRLTGKLDPTRTVVRTYSKGTFSVWLRTATSDPTCGEVTRRVPGAVQTQRAGIIGSPNPLSPMPPNFTINLARLAGVIPSLFYISGKLGITPTLHRCTFRHEGDEKSGTLSLNVHPGSSESATKLANQIKVKFSSPDQVHFEDLKTGFLLRLSYSEEQVLQAEMPGSISVSADEAFLLGEELPLNEFGVLYLASFACGTLARYYPDLWTDEISRSTPYFSLVENISESIAARAPLLALGELEQVQYLEK